MSSETEEELKRTKKFELLSKAFGTPGSLEDLVGQAFKQPAFKAPRHQDTIRKRSQDLRPSKKQFRIVGRKVPQIESITEMLVEDEFTPKKIDPDIRRVKEGDFIQSRGCKLARKKKTRIT